MTKTMKSGVTLRPYQEKAVREVRVRLEERRRVLMVSPTGSGKTTTGAAIVADRYGRVLWMAHRVELLKQARATLIEAGIPEDDVGIISGSEKQNVNARVLVASVDTLRTRVALPPAGLVVIDEGHRVEAKSYKKILAMTPDAQLLGLTATPCRLDGQRLGDTFADMFVAATPLELIADGYLSQPIVYGIPKDTAAAMVKGVSKRGRDFAVGELGRSMMSSTLMGDAVSECARVAPGERTIVFAATREHGRALADRFQDAGRTAAFLDGNTPTAEREAVLAALGSGTVEVVVNVDVLTEGFDCPSVTCVVIARPTESLSRYLQYCGRASRPYGGMAAKILDHAGNVYRHGLPWKDREWSLDAPPKRDGDAPVKCCAECRAIIPAGATECPECGAIQPVAAREEEAADVELEIVRADEAERARVRGVLEELAAEKGLGADWIDTVFARVMEAA